MCFLNIKLIKERDTNLTPFEQILYNRGITNCSENDFLNIGWDCVNNPHNLEHLDEGLDMYEKHIKNNSKIAILNDVDMDGFASSAILINYTKLQIQIGDWQGYTPELISVFHKTKSHGLDDKEMMRRIRDEIKPDLFVIPDASGTKEQYKALTDLGIDLLVLDHHDTQEKGEDNDKVVVINNQHSPNYTNKDFSGAGVMWQFCRGLDERLTFVCADHYLDLVAIGNVGDVMDMRSKETRFICQEGMKDDHIFSPLINYMKMSDFKMKDNPYCAHIISFNIAPLFNAVCRVGSDEDKEMLFKCLLVDEAEKRIPSGKRGHTDEMVRIIEEGYRLASNARTRQNTRKDKLLELIDNVISEERLFENKVIVLAFDDFKEDYPSLAGLVCNGLIEYYNRPVILTFKNANGGYSGSLRAPSNIPAYDNFRKQCEESGLCSYASGHPQAAGIGIKPDCVQKLTDYFNEKYKNVDTGIFEKVDFIFDVDDPELPKVIEELSRYSTVWGTNIEEPIFAIKNVKIAQTTMMLCGAKKTTLKISAPNVEFINFKSSQTEYDCLKLPYDGVEQYYLATIIGHDPTINTYRGSFVPQLKYTSYDLGIPKYDF